MASHPASDHPHTHKTLRERALELVTSSRAQIDGMRGEDVQKLIYELQVHQAELEIQNEELRVAQVELAESRDRYSDLYEFAPVGYLTLDRQGGILEANLTAATMLGVERQHLLRGRIQQFIARESQDRWYLHQQLTWVSESKAVCELELGRPNGAMLTVRLESIPCVPADDRRFHTALIDISDLKCARQQLEDSEWRYRRLTEAVTDYIYRVRVESGRAMETIHGPNCETMTGYAPKDFAANSLLWIAMVPPEDRALVEQQAARVLSGDEAAPVEHRIQRKDGQLRWVLNTVVPHHDAHGRLIAYDGLLRDITERKTAEQALAQLNATLEQRVTDQTREIRLLAKAMANLGEGIIITGDDCDWPEPTITFVNESMCRITGYREVELVGRSRNILQGEQTDQNVLAKMKKQLATGEPAVCEVIQHRKDGTPYEAEIAVTPLFDPNGRRTNFVSIHRDITERKRTERAIRANDEQMRAILNTAFNAIVTINEQGVIVAANPATERMFGYTATELIGRNVNMLMPPPFANQHDQFIARYLKTGEAHIIGKGRELVGLRKNGTTFPLDLAVSQVDHLKLFTGIILDVTERKELQKQVLEIASDEQRRIGQELHDGICQELTGLGLLASSLCDLLAAMEREMPPDGKIPPSKPDGAQALRRIADKLHGGLVNSHKHAQTLSRGIMPVQIDSQGLRSALEELALSINSLEHATCRIECRGRVDVRDNATATHLYRIAQEAVNNALKHSQATSIQLVLRNDNGNLLLEINDNGVGIDGKRAESGEVTGVGLRIMRYRASLIGATIQIGNHDEGGTSVRCVVRSQPDREG